jgi:hypothetical protein
MATFTAIVDDQNPSVQYSGNWVKEGATEEFNGTTSRGVDSTATASFTFNGESSALSRYVSDS